jgi:stage II sporulation protein D
MGAAAMSIRRKLILMGICIGIILIVLSVNVFNRLKEDNGPENVTVKGTIMTRAEAYRLLSYLEYNKSEREAIPSLINYSDGKMSGWYDTYVNAVCKMGLIEDIVSINPGEALTYGYCKELMDKLILTNPDYQVVYTGLSFQFTNADNDMSIKDFLQLYKALLAIGTEEDKKVTEVTLLVVGREVTEDGIDRMVTNLGKYYYLDAKSYEIDEPIDSADFIDQYMDKGVEAYVCNQEIVYIAALSTDKIMVHNVWIKQGSELQVDTYINGIDKSFTTASKLKDPIEKVVGDITIENQKIVKINVKPDMIQGKVLRSGDGFIEIEGYGKVPMEEDFKIYKIYGELSMEPTGSILVGYDNTDFVVSGGKLSAALITESIKAENIRVLIKTTGYKDIYHADVELTATSDFTVSTKNTTKSYKKGDKVSLKPGNDLFKDGRITVKTESEDAKIKLLSVERAYGNPKYRGSIEIAEDDSGLIVVNELPLEEYLYAVIPSEMPTSYGSEALKVQAVCARSYSYRHLLANSLSKYGAHVDDSSSYQVYNNIAENEDSILAVKDTYGEVVKYDNEVITAYYYSTSCGHTTDPSSVWEYGEELPYLKGKLLVTEQEGEEAVEAQSAQGEKYMDLSSEENFKSFIESTDLSTYDSQFSWYRWNVTMSIKDIKSVIDSKLSTRYNSNPDLILTKTSDAEDGKNAIFKSVPIDTVGDIKDISVEKRESSGIISELLITGSEHTIKVLKEYNIRALLAPLYDSIIRQDGSEVNNLNLLPSAFFMIEEQKADSDSKSFKLTGGGFGHGVGMSQNAVKSLVDSGKDYKQIVSYFYTGTEIGFIYD